jgi:hypothetical protein
VGKEEWIKFTDSGTIMISEFSWNLSKGSSFTFFLTSRYRRFAPIGDCLYKKQLGRVGLKFNLLEKKGKFSVKIMVIR